MLRTLMIAALSLTLATGVADSSCSQGEPAPSQGGHKQQPAPAPDPAPKDKKFPGNVAITVYWEQAQKQTVVVFDYGQGKMHRTGKRPGGHWDATVKPNQTVYAAVVPAHPGERGYIHVYIIQQNNGRKICEDSNKSTDSNGGADCGGVVVI